MSLIGKELACQCRKHKRLGFNPLGQENPWRRVWQPTPVFLPGEFHGERSLVGYNLWGHKTSDTAFNFSENVLCTFHVLFPFCHKHIKGLPLLAVFLRWKICSASVLTKVITTKWPARAGNGTHRVDSPATLMTFMWFLPYSHYFENHFWYNISEGCFSTRQFPWALKYH